MGKSAGNIIGTILTVAAVIVAIASGQPQFAAYALTMKVAAASMMIAGGLLSAQKQQGADMPAFDMKFEQGGHLINARSTSEPIPILYGEMRVGGDQAMITSTGDNNEYLHIIQTISEGEIDSVSKLYLDDKDAADPFFDGYVHWEFFSGSYTQNVCQTFKDAFSDWEDAMRGTAYIYVRLKYSQDKFQTVPLITVKAKGRKLYDPRTGLTAWSDNGALVTRDIITNSVYGFGLRTDVLNNQSYIDAANAFDVMAYKWNGIINSKEAAQDIIDRVILNFRGFIIYVDGLYKLKTYAYDSPVLSITDDDIIEDSQSITGPGLPETPNRLKVKFIDPDHNYTVNDFLFADSAAITIDGMEREAELNLIGTADYDQATELATFQLERLRLNKTYNITIGPEGSALELGDVISATISYFGWTAQSARVVGVQYMPNYQTGLTLVEETALLYDKVINVSPHTFFTGNFVDPHAVPADVYNVTATEELYGTKNNILTRLNGSFTPADAYRFESAEIWTSYDNITYTRYKTGSAGTFIIEPVNEGVTIYIKIMPISIYQVKRPLASITPFSKFIFGKRAKPQDVTSFWGQASLGGLLLSWDAVSDVDIDYYKLRYTPDIVTGIWNTSVDIAKAYTTSITLPAALSGTYLIKAVDTTGNESDNAKIFIATTPAILKWNAQVTLTENPAFTGTKTDMLVANGELLLGAAGLFDDIPDFDAVANLDRYGGTAPVGYYETSVVALGSVQTSRCSVSVQFYGVDATSLFDSPELFDSSEWMDEDTSGIGVQPQISLSQDGSTWSDWQNFSVGDFTAKSYKFRLKAYSTQANQYPVITALQFNVDMPDRDDERASSVACPAGGLTITYSKPFMALPMLGASIQNASSGDTIVWSSQSLTGAVLTIKNGGSGVSRTVDWIAKGY